jgi:hypothetical protein
MLYLSLAGFLTVPVVICEHTYFTLPADDPERLWWDTIGFGMITLFITYHFNQCNQYFDGKTRTEREPVADGGRNGHSLFAYYLLRGLEEIMKDVVDLENLFHTYVWKPVTEIGGPRPNVGRLKTPMDEDGQFVLQLNIEIVVPFSKRD